MSRPPITTPQDKTPNMRPNDKRPHKQRRPFEGKGDARRGQHSNTERSQAQGAEQRRHGTPQQPGERAHQQRGDQHHDRRRYERAREDDGIVRLYGIHAVEAALQNAKRPIRRLQLTDNAENRLAEALKSRSFAHERVQPRDLDRLLGTDTVHQGALLETEPLPSPLLDELASRAQSGGPLIVLDQVTDPHNVGAILRSAAAFGASGVVMTHRNSPPLSGALAKSASGALEHVPVALVPNLARALEQLADLGLARVGLDGEATDLLEDQDLKSGIALVFGAEGKGLRRLTREHCDRLCRITTAGPLQSLNVSNAAAISLHAAAVQRRKG